MCTFTVSQKDDVFCDMIIKIQNMSPKKSLFLAQKIVIFTLPKRQVYFYWKDFVRSV
jgi:hypothetical protein